MRIVHWLIQGIGRLRQMLGWQGLMVAVITLVSFAFGLGMLLQEYQRPHQTRREVLHSLLSSWMRAPDYLGLNLIDYTERYRRSPTDEQLRLVQVSLKQLGEDLEQRDAEFPLISVEGLTLSTHDRRRVAEWQPIHLAGAARSVDIEEIEIPDPSGQAGHRLRVAYRVAPEVNAVFLSNEAYDDRLIEALVGLSGCSLLCFGYMVLYVQELREHIARESAREATLDLADRTCHELGNVSFVVANERRNLDSHITLLDRFISEERPARVAAAERAGIDPAMLGRFEQALEREYERRGIAPDFELRRSSQMARDVCRQISVCSDYITLTVRDLDGYLKQSLTHEPSKVQLTALDPEDLFDEAVALLTPRIEASETRVTRTSSGRPVVKISADRRLMVHVLVNLIKNAIEAVVEFGRTPEIGLEAEVDSGGTWVALRVSDNGTGIHESIRVQLFQDGVSTKGAGRGRGLAIVHDSVQAQGGTVEVESQSGQGSVFRIRVRKYDADAQSGGQQA